MTNLPYMYDGADQKWGISTLAITLILAYIVYSSVTALFNVFFHPLAQYPGPKLRAAFYFPEAWSLVRGCDHTITKALHDKYGEVVRLSPDQLSYNSAQAWKDIYGFKAGRRQVPKDPLHYRLPGLSQKLNILTAADADHGRQRKLLSHAFSDGAMREQESLVNEFFEQFVSRIAQSVDSTDNGRVDMNKAFTTVTWDIIWDLALGKTSQDPDVVVKPPFWLIPLLLPLANPNIYKVAQQYPLGRAFFDALFALPAAKRLMRSRTDHMQARAAERLDLQSDRLDFMRHVQRHNDERGMTRAEILETFPILLAAGVDTTAANLAGATFYILTHPEKLARLKSEVRAAARTSADLNFANVNALPYLGAVLEESLRLYPPIPGSMPRRTGPEGEEICGKWVPPKISVGVHQMAANHASTNFADPEAFSPERWLEDAPARYAQDDRAAMQPFGTGPRNCLGKNLAYYEMRAILARLVWHFDLTLLPESYNWRACQRCYAMMNRGELWVRAQRRHISEDVTTEKGLSDAKQTAGCDGTPRDDD